MISNDKVSAQDMSTLDILVFTLSGVYCGIDGDLVARMMMCDEAEQGEVKIQWLHKVLPCGDREVVYRNPRVVTLKDSTVVTGLGIDQPRDIIKVPVKSICPLPYLFEMTKGLQAFWGAFVLDEKVVLLIDPHRLPY